MDYYKIFGKDGSVIAAEQIEDVSYVCYQASNNTVLRCSRVKAQGIISADGSQIYQLYGYTPMPGDYLVADPITQTEYDILIEELDIDDDDTEPEPSPDDEDSGSDVMTPQQMRERIIALETDRAELRKELSEKDTRLGYLEDAMLEVGGILYGDDDF